MKNTAKLFVALLSFIVVAEAHAMRWYSPNTGRWLSRDPIEEKGGQNLYGFVGNNAVYEFDSFGLVIGTVTVVSSYAVSTDAGFFDHKRGWYMDLRWTPPAGWAGKCDCRCKKAIWIQDIRRDDSLVWQRDWGESDYAKYTLAWDCGNQNSKFAELWDEAKATGTLLSLRLVSPMKFSARSQVKCVLGPDAGKIYHTVDWGYRWSYDTTPVGLGPIYVKYEDVGL